MDSLQVGNFLAVAVCDTADKYMWADVKLAFEAIGANGEYFPDFRGAWVLFNQVILYI